MINDLFGVVARIFPVLVVVAILAALIFLARAFARVSSGSVGGGPPRIAEPVHIGLQRIPWELQSLPDELRSNSTQPVDQLVRRADALGVPVSVPSNVPSPVAIDIILDQLETALGLPPLGPANHFQPPPQSTPES